MSPWTAFDEVGCSSSVDVAAEVPVEDGGPELGGVSPQVPLVDFDLFLGVVEFDLYSLSPWTALMLLILELMLELVPQEKVAEMKRRSLR
jgi:hypothetical protein